MKNARIGWVGLGAIGTQMVKRLLAAGLPVVTYARGKGIAEVEAAGATTCLDYAELAAQSDILFLCVYDDSQMHSVAFDHGALAALRPGALLVIHTTGSPSFARELGAMAPDGVRVLDVCFSGGPADVSAGRLTIMAGGDDEAFESLTPILACYAEKIHHVGPLGHGQMLKLLNNMLFATNLMNAFELLHLAERQGFKPAKIVEVLKSSSGASYALNIFKAAAPIEDVMAGTRRYLQKDVAAAVATAKEFGLDASSFTTTAAFFGEQ